MYAQIEEIEIIMNGMMKANKIKESCYTFYEPKIRLFFNEFIDKDKPLDALTYYDVNSFLDSLEGKKESTKLNYYQAMNTFFRYTQRIGKTKEIMFNVKKPEEMPRKHEILSDEDTIKLKKYVGSQGEDLNNRLLVAFFLFTGLSRTYVANLKYKDLLKIDGEYKISISKNKKETIIPLKTELQLIIHEYLTCNPQIDEQQKLFKHSDNMISEQIKKLTREILGNKKTITIFSNTFIHNALNEGADVLKLSKNLQVSLKTIQSHIEEGND